MSNIPENGKVLLKFSAEWCSPCKMLKDILVNNPPSIPVIEFDIDEDFETASKYNIRGVPTLILLDDGEEARRKVGLLSSKQLVDFIEQ